MRKTFLTIVATITCSLLYPLSNSLAQGTAFTYQGRLNDGANPAQGSYDLRFTVFDANSGGTIVAGPQTNNALALSNGLFTVGLDFGTGVFNGNPRWLEIAVRTNNTGAFTTLAQRQAITATPYAVTATEATSGNIARLSVSNSTVTALGVPTVTSGFITGAAVTRGGSGYITPPSVTVNDPTGSGAVITATISNGAVVSLTPQNAGSGYSTGATLTIGAPPSNAYQVFASTNYFPGVNTLTNPNNVFAGNGAGLTNLRAWGLTGNAGTTPAANFVGTTDNQALEFQVNGQRALRLEPTASLAPNVIAGFSSNAAGLTAIGSVIGGGGSLSGPNFVNENLATIGGGGQNTNEGRFATIGGGANNKIRLDNFSFATIAGGNINDIRTGSSAATIGGGQGNVILTNGPLNTIAGGHNNLMGNNSSYCTVGGGQVNTIASNATHATIPGGHLNFATNFAFAAGRRAKALHDGAFVWADGQNADFPSSGANQFLIRASGGVGINRTNPAADLDVNGTALMQELGVNTSNPMADLHVNGHALIQGVLTPTSTSSSNLLNLLVGVTTNGSLNGISFYEGSSSKAMSFGYDGSSSSSGNSLRIYGNTDTSLVTFQNGGNVGIGTSAPATVLHAVDAGDAQISVQSADTGGHRWVVQSSGVTGNIALDGSFQVIDRTLGKSRLSIGTNGSVGIGTGSSTVPLTIRATGSATEWLTLTSTSDVARWQINEFGGGLNIAQSSVTDGRLFLANNGNAGIGTITPTNKLHVAGGISATAFVNTSDRNAKENFAPVHAREVLDKVAALPITTWNYKEMRDGRHMGPMAQDFYAAFSLGGSDKTITTIDPDGVALAAIQGLNELLKEKDRKITQLEERLGKLEKAMTASSSSGAARALSSN